MNLLSMKDLTPFQIKHKSNMGRTALNICRTCKREDGFFLIRCNSEVGYPGKLVATVGGTNISGRWFLGRIRGTYGMEGVFEVIVHDPDNKDGEVHAAFCDTLAELEEVLENLRQRGSESFRAKDIVDWNLFEDSTFSVMGV